MAEGALQEGIWAFSFSTGVGTKIGTQTSMNIRPELPSSGSQVGAKEKKPYACCPHGRSKALLWAGDKVVDVFKLRPWQE